MLYAFKILAHQNAYLQGRRNLLGSGGTLTITIQSRLEAENTQQWKVCFKFAPRCGQNRLPMHHPERTSQSPDIQLIATIETDYSCAWTLHIEIPLHIEIHFTLQENISILIRDL
jgi:hypothetical protein